jgi:hypothetical protein
VPPLGGVNEKIVARNSCVAQGFESRKQKIKGFLFSAYP